MHFVEVGGKKRKEATKKTLQVLISGGVDRRLLGFAALSYTKTQLKKITRKGRIIINFIWIFPRKILHFWKLKNETLKGDFHTLWALTRSRKCSSPKQSLRLLRRVRQVHHPWTWMDCSSMMIWWLFWVAAFVGNFVVKIYFNVEKVMSFVANAKSKAKSSVAKLASRLLWMLPM